MKKSALLAASLILSSPLMAADFLPDTAPETLKDVVKQFDENVGVKSVTFLEEPALYEVVTLTNEIAYLSETGRFLINGQVVDLQQGVNLTQSKRDDLMKVDWDTLPEANFVVNPGQKLELAVFTDVDCPYCKRLERLLEKTDDITIHYYMYPLESLHPTAKATSEQILCSDDPVVAMRDYMLHKVQPSSDVTDSCRDSVAEAMAFGESKGMTGTPTLVFKDGRRLPGSPKTLDQLYAILNK